MRRAISFLSFIWVFGAVQAWGQVITPSIATNVTSGPAPLAVSFDATGTGHSNSSIHTNRFHELLYLWDYDDPTSGTWAPTGKSRNQMSGPLGAHVFEPSSFPESCGGKACQTYLVKLEVRDGAGNQASKTILISVYDPDSTGATGWGDSGETVCISRTTDHRDCPVLATRRSNQTGNLEAILNSEINLNGFRRVLLHAGQAWNMTGPYELSPDGPGLIGSYGSGKFTVNFSSMGGKDAFRLSGDNWRIQDVQFTGSMPDQAAFRSFRQTANFLIQRTRSNPNSLRDVVSMSVQMLPDGGDTMLHRHLFFVDNQWPDLLSPNGSYQLYVAAWGLNILGNDLGRSHKEHNIRVETGEAVLISNNKLGPNGWGKNALNLRDMPNGTCPACAGCPKGAPCKPFCGRETRYYLVQDNHFLCQFGACIGQGTQTCAEDQYPRVNMPSHDHLFERNFFEEAPGGDMGGDAIGTNGGGAANRFVVRNNIVDETGWTWANGFLGQAGVRYSNNTCYRSDTTGKGKAVCITPQGASECYNNVMYAPNWSGTIRWWQDEPWAIPCASAANNFDNGLTRNLTRNPFVSAAPSNPADFAPGSGSQLIDSGRAISGLFDDQSLHCRAGTPDAGAVERGASATCAAEAGSTESLGQPGKPILYP